MMGENREKKIGRGESFVGRRSFGKMERNRPMPVPSPAARKRGPVPDTRLSSNAFSL